MPEPEVLTKVKNLEKFMKLLKRQNIELTKKFDAIQKDIDLLKLKTQTIKELAKPQKVVWKI